MAIDKIATDSTQALISYGTGGGSVAFAWLLDISTTAQAVAVILGMLVVALRLAHDILKFIRYLKEDHKK